MNDTPEAIDRALELAQAALHQQRQRALRGHGATGEYAECCAADLTIERLREKLRASSSAGVQDRPPNPGSDAAANIGCTCPRLDNARGRGAWGSSGPDAVFWITEGCPVHVTPTYPPTDGRHYAVR